MRSRVQHRLFWWLQSIVEVIPERHDWLMDPPLWLQAHLCWIGGHVPVPDHCGIPEHDYCAHCMAPTPSLAER